MIYALTWYNAENRRYKMAHACNQHIVEVLNMARQLLILSDMGDLDSEDDGCRVLYGIVRDCAYKIRAQAEREREAHKRKGIWNIAVNIPEAPTRKSNIIKLTEVIKYDRL